MVEATNGSAQPNGKLRGRTTASRNSAKAKRGFFARLFSIVARLATWGAILTVLFRCPSTLEECDESSPFVCKHYFRLKNAVSPHLQPYYDEYAAPYVEIAQPYYHTVKTNVVVPTVDYAVHYGSPWVKKGQDYAWSQWETTGRPHLVHLQTVARARYDESLAPHVAQAEKALSPYYGAAKVQALYVFDDFVTPGYELVKPYAIQGYEVSYNAAVTTVVPAASWAWSQTYAFLDTAVWPQLRVVYTENVEPQLVRIGDRLGRYKSKAKFKVLRDKKTTTKSSTEASQEPIVTGETEHPTTTSSVADVSSTTNVVNETPSQVPSQQANEEPSHEPIEQAATSEDSDDQHQYPVSAPPAVEGESEERRNAREMVAADLKQWQSRFAGQAEEGAADIEDRVDHIARNMMEENAGKIGEGLVQKLEKTIEGEIKTLKNKLSAIASEADPSSTEESQAAAIQAVRAAGVGIKTQAQAIRGWRADYDVELKETVLAMADVHFKILDETRALALQQLGMRWAWTEGVTYKDWAKYHELKSTLNEWTEELKQLIVTHPTLLEAQDASAKVEDEAMAIASSAAHELARLKEVSKWKILSSDGSDEFDLDAIKAAITEKENAEKARFEKEKAEQERAEQEKVEREKAEREAAEQEAEKQGVAKEAKVDEADLVIEDNSPVASDESDLDFDPDSDASFVIVDKAEEDQKPLVPEEDTQVVVDNAEPMLPPVPDHEHEAETATEEVAASNNKPESNDADVSTEPATEETDTPAPEVAADVQASGATAEETGISDPTHNDAPEANHRGEPEAVVGAEQTQEPSDATDEEQDDVEPPARDASKDEERPVKAAFLGAAAQEVPERKPVFDDEGADEDLIARATSAAQNAYADASSAAAERYSMAASIVSKQMYGTPKPVHEQMLSSLTSAYDDAVAAASSRFNDVVESASSGLYGATTTASAARPSGASWERVESLAAQRLREGRLWAELQYESALVAMGLTTAAPTSTSDKYYQQAKQNYYAALGVAQERYSSFLAAASSAWPAEAATASPTDVAGFASSIAFVASESVASAGSAASEAAGSAYSAASEGIASVVESADEAVGAAVGVAEEQFYAAGKLAIEGWEKAVEEISLQIYGEPTPIGWYDNVAESAGSYVNVATEAAESAAAAASAEAVRQRDAVSKLVSELVHGKEAPFAESVLSRLSDAYVTATSSAGSIASEATEAVKEKVQHARDEL